MPLSLDEVHDLIDSWEIDPDVNTVVPAMELFAADLSAQVEGEGAS